MSTKLLHSLYLQFFQTIRLLLVGFVPVLFVACTSSRKAANPNGTIFINTIRKNSVSNKIMLTHYDSIRFKYAKQLGIDPNIIVNLKLYDFIDSWWNTPYRWGGTDTNGIDCSAFTQRLVAEVYNVSIPRTSASQFLSTNLERLGPPKFLSEGDLVFFRTLNNTFISHVGLYLQNNWFVNASSLKGVSISSINEPYWKKRYVAAARIIIKQNKVAKQ